MSLRLPAAILVVATPVVACGGALDSGHDDGPSDAADSGRTGSGDDGSGDVGGYGQDASTTVGSDGGDGTVASDGAEDGQGTNDVEDGGICVSPDAATLTLPDLDTPCYFGSTGRELLAQVGSTYASTFRPSGPPSGYFDGGYVWSGSLTPTALALTFTYSGGPVKCSPPPPQDCDPPPGADSGFTCSPCGLGTGIVSLPLDVTFKTADGAFDEQFVATATVYWPGGQVEWQGSLPASQLHGTYPPIFSPNETVIFYGQLAGPSYDNGSVDEMVWNKISGGGGSWP
jgi:hypothetical protein